mmetsp:Transcript_49150/g.154288  ORF Transcript_49150/g.154288 Transcript_49150/m.154288 type:complete len:251 (-) Transcript_49150:262-1014(-)
MSKQRPQTRPERMRRPAQERGEDLFPVNPLVALALKGARRMRVKLRDKREGPRALAGGRENQPVPWDGMIENTTPVVCLHYCEVSLGGVREVGGNNLRKLFFRWVIRWSVKLKVVHVTDPHDGNIGDFTGEPAMVAGEKMKEMLFQQLLCMGRVVGVVQDQPLHMRREVGRAALPRPPHSLSVLAAVLLAAGGIMPVGGAGIMMLLPCSKSASERELAQKKPLIPPGAEPNNEHGGGGEHGRVARIDDQA